MVGNPFDEKFYDTVDALLGQRPSSQTSATLRVADFCYGSSDLTEAVVGAGLEIAYLHDLDIPTQPLNFDDIPPFDLVTASLPGGDQAQEDAFGLVARFLRVRRPVSFVLVGRARRLSDEFLQRVQHETQQFGYHIRSGDAGGLGLRRDAFVVGTMSGSPFVWPPGVVPRSDDNDSTSHSDEGLEEGPLEGFVLPAVLEGRERVSAPLAVPIAQAVIEQVAAHALTHVLG